MDERSNALLREGRRLHDRAVAEGGFGHAARAVRTLRRALEVLADLPQPGPVADKLVAEVWLSLAVNEAEVHGVERGLAMIAEAGPRVERTGDPALRVRLHGNYGFLATRAGNLALATEQLALAMPMIAHATPHDRIYVLLNSGNISLTGAGSARRAGCSARRPPRPSRPTSWTAGSGRCTTWATSSSSPATCPPRSPRWTRRPGSGRRCHWASGRSTGPASSSRPG